MAHRNKAVMEMPEHKGSDIQQNVITATVHSTSTFFMHEKAEY